MLNRFQFASALFVAAMTCTAPAFAGVVLITQAKALSGGVTPGDGPGFPVTLSRVGSYRLDTNLTVTADKVGIQVTEKNIDIDLNGFSLLGAGVALHGITGTASNVTIRNGTVYGFKFDGINGDQDFWIIKDMRVVNNGREGIRVDFNAKIENSIVSNNRGIGIIGSNLHIESNLINLNGKEGIWTTVATVLGNHIYGNGSHGILSTNVTGYGNNTLYANNFGGQQVTGGFFQMHPNACSPACP